MKPGTMVCVLTASLLAATSCSALTAAPVYSLPVSPIQASTPQRPLPATGFTVSPNSQTRVWLAHHPRDPRSATLRAALGSKPDSLWLTGGSRDIPNLTDLLRLARKTRTTPIITLYNIPGRDDGLTGPTRGVTAAGYRTWVDRIAATIGNSDAIVIVEPDGLWLADRQFRGNRAGFDNRIASIRYAAATLSRNAGAHVYLEAGTTSGSVTPGRMAQLLRGAGASSRVGYAVNVSSFAPEPAITSYAQQIRATLASFGISNPRYVVDTSRNGNPNWDNDTWCNPPGRRIGHAPTPRPAGGALGLDAHLWVKAPGASDGSCGVGKGSSGGDFLPDVAVAMVR